MYALQHEIRDPIRRAVAMDLENERATKMFVLNLKPEIELRTSTTKPNNLQEAQDAAFEAELLIGEIERNKGIIRNRTQSVINSRQTFRCREISPRPPAMTTRPSNAQPANRTLVERPPPKCFKCQQTGHLANSCPQQRNFPLPSHRNLPPPRAFNVEVEDPENKENQSEYIQQQEDYYPSECLQQLEADEC